MDGLECSVLNLKKVQNNDVRFDSEYYSKRNLYLSEKLNSIGTKTIGNYGGKLDCSAFYPSITEYYSNDRKNIPFLRVNEIKDGLITITDHTVFLPSRIIEDNRKTIALAYPGDIIIAKGGNTLAKVGLVTNEYPMYATCRDVIILRTDDLDALNKYYLWAFLHSEYGQGILWRSASQTGQPHLTLPAIMRIKVPDSILLQNTMQLLYEDSVKLKDQAEKLYKVSEIVLNRSFGLQHTNDMNIAVAVKELSNTFVKTGRLDAEYYQPKYDRLFSTLSKYTCKPLGGENGLVLFKKSIEPGSEYYQSDGVPFIRVSDISKFEIEDPEIHLPLDIVDNIEDLYPEKDTILFSKDGSVGIAYKVEDRMEIITSGALLHLTIKNQDEILPDYLTLVLNSPIVQLQAERDTNGAIIQHWKPSEIEKVVIPVLDMDKQIEISDKVKESFALRKKSKRLLEDAKRAVEIAIEQDEESAIEWLKDRVDL